jgi:hypothetical protein
MGDVMQRERFNTGEGNRELGLPLRRPSLESFAFGGRAESLLGEIAARDVIRPNLDVHAQYALVRISCSIPVVMAEVGAFDQVNNEYGPNQEIDRKGICPGTF